MPPDTRMTRQQRGRLRLMLQACDGRNRGASYRAIAEAIFGTERVAADPGRRLPCATALSAWWKAAPA